MMTINVYSIKSVHPRIICSIFCFCLNELKYLLTYTLTMKRILMANYQIKTYVFVGRSLSSKSEGMGFKLIQNSMHVFEIRYYFSRFEYQITVIKIIFTLRQLVSQQEIQPFSRTPKYF